MAGAAKRRHQVQVQAPSVGKDALGGASQSWTTLFSTAVAITPLSGRELVAAQAMHAEVTHKVEGTFRAEWANPVAAARFRIVFGTRVFNIHDVQNVEERNRDVLITVSEGLNDG
jgi:SPP1 family predicted phage head-tail adaptor